MDCIILNDIVLIQANSYSISTTYIIPFYGDIITAVPYKYWSFTIWYGVVYYFKILNYLFNILLYNFTICSLLFQKSGCTKKMQAKLSGKGLSVQKTFEVWDARLAASNCFNWAPRMDSCVFLNRQSLAAIMTNCLQVFGAPSQNDNCESWWIYVMLVPVLTCSGLR